MIFCDDNHKVQYSIFGSQHITFVVAGKDTSNTHSDEFGQLVVGFWKDGHTLDARGETMDGSKCPISNSSSYFE